MPQRLPKAERRPFCPGLKREIHQDSGWGHTLETGLQDLEDLPADTVVSGEIHDNCLVSGVRGPACVREQILPDLDAHLQDPATKDVTVLFFFVCVI